MKNATKKTKVIKKKAVTGEAGKRGRTSAYAGKKVTAIKKTEDTALRDSGNVRTCWDVIAKAGDSGILFEKYREKTGMPGFARKALADFIKVGYAKVSRAQGEKSQPKKEKEPEAAAV
jgi:hypothetical protein